MNVNDALNSSKLATEAQRRQEGRPAGELGKDDFLRLLTTQLQSQDPLNPTDNSEFVAQLSQFASLERLENMATGMNNMALSQSANTSAQVVSFIGKHVRVTGSEFGVDALGEAQELYADIPEESRSVEILIKDEDGKVIRTLEAGSRGSGLNTFEWDGLRDDGTPAPEGSYSFEVQAFDDEGERIADVATSTIQAVKGVTYENGFPVLVLDSGVAVSLGDVLEISESADLISPTP